MTGELHAGEYVRFLSKQTKDYVRNTYDVSVTAQTYLQEYEKIVCKWSNSKKDNAD
ncbi:hypothetical protein [Phocaeicola sartorii]|uniref:hypothetical protein n=1 Tax=Phocaeicola sartorii TaxID=671267 RepID=UPI0013621D8E|nr:hypothetical protein [Phocaeicola sartorii]